MSIQRSGTTTASSAMRSRQPNLRRTSASLREASGFERVVPDIRQAFHVFRGHIFRLQLIENNDEKVRRESTGPTCLTCVGRSLFYSGTLPVSCRLTKL